MKEEDFPAVGGVCPQCHQSDDTLNYRKVHFGVCNEHKVYWLIGSGLFSCWMHEDETIWQKNQKLLESYECVDSYNPAAILYASDVPYPEPGEELNTPEPDDFLKPEGAA